MRYVLMPQAVRNALPALINHSVSLFKNSSLAMAIGVAELTHAVKEVENLSFRTFETYLIATIALSGLLARSSWRSAPALHRRVPHRGSDAEPCCATSSRSSATTGCCCSSASIPNGPLGGIAATLILSVLSIVLAFPLSMLLALARLSQVALLLWPSTALVYVARGVPLLMLILWVYFMVPLLIGAQRPGLRDDARARS